MGWNGLDLINDFSAELGDTSNGYKTKVLRYIVAGIRDIATAHNWPFLREKAQVVLEANERTHAICLVKPAAPTVALLAGGSLALLNEYKFLVTFYEEQSGVESIAGDASAGITPLGADLSVTLSDIPFSTSPLVTARKIYVSKAGGAFAYHGVISNNLEEIPGTPDPLIDPPTPITYVVSSETTSSITPPEINAIHEIDGDLFIEGQKVLSGTTIQNIIFQTNASDSSGTPEVWAPINQEEVLVYPKPTSDTTVSFYYFKLPAQVFGIVTSVPEIPIWLYDDLRRYVLWRGFDFRDRAGKESKEITYRENLKVTISRKGSPLKRAGRVRSVTPDSDGNLT